MLILLAILFIIIFGVIAIFAFPQFSPIPYFPSNSKDLSIILKALNIHSNQVIFDLGAGDGIIIFEAAHKSHAEKLNTKFVAVEMNPVLVTILHIRRLLHPNKKNINIILGDMFKVNYSEFMSKNSTATVYIYVSPRFIPKIISNVQKHFKVFDFVSYYYPIEKNMKPSAEGVHSVYTKTFKSKS